MSVARPVRMSAAPFMQLYVADYLADTQHLSLEHNGAYLLLLMAMWRSGGSLPNDEIKLRRTVKATAKQWGRIRDDVMAFFNVDGDRITQKRLSIEFQKASDKSRSRASAGSLGGKAKSLKSGQQSLAKATDLLQHSSEPDIRKKETPTVPKGTERKSKTVDEKLYSEFEQDVWKEFPRHPNSRKDPAFKKYSDLPPELRARCIGGVARYSQRFDDTVDPKRSKEERLDFVPHLVTWINQKGWEAEYDRQS